MKFKHFAVFFILFQDVVLHITNSDISVTSIAETSTNLYSNCSFELNNGETEHIIQSHIEEDIELIFLHFNIPNLESDIFGINGTIYSIFDLVRTNAGHGNELLLLHPQFEQYSLGILMFGVEHVQIDLKPVPKVCFSTITEQQVYTKLFEFVSSKFKLLQNNDQTHNRLCNMQIRDVEGSAEFYYQCCYRNDTGHFSCSAIESTFWMNVLYGVMNAFYIITIFFCPLLIPTSWYKEHVYNFTLKLPQNYKMKFGKSNDSSKEILNRNKINNIFKKYIDKNMLKISVSSVELEIKIMNTVSSSFVPSGLLYFIHRKLIKCQIKNNDSLKECCQAHCCVCPCGRWLQWKKCLKTFMQIVCMICLLMPWSIRIAFFYIFEEQDRIKRESFAETRHLKFQTLWNLTYYLKPDHPLWILCYVFAIIMMIIIKLAFKRLLPAAEMHKVFHKIRMFKLKNMSKQNVEKILVPCKKYGVMGILIAPLYLVVIFEYIPLIYMILTLLLLIITVGRNWKRGEVHMTFGLFFLQIFFYIGIILMMITLIEVVIFYLTILMYVGIGIILNGSSVLMYVTFAGLLIFYAYDSVRNVEKRFELFFKDVIEYLVSDRQDMFYTSDNVRDCVIQFKCKRPDDPREKLSSIKVKDKKLYLSSDPFLFFDENGKPFITERLFFKICEIKSIGAPGSLWENYKKSFINFIVILLFLFIVILIVLAFGKTSGVPDTYQALATLGGGLIPLVLRGYFFKSNVGSAFKTDNVFVRKELHNFFEENPEEFRITDLDGEEDQCESYDSEIMVHTDETTDIYTHLDIL